MPSSPKKYKRLLALAIGLTVGLAVAEVCTRAVGAITSTSYSLELDPVFRKEWLFEPHTHVGWIPKPHLSSDAEFEARTGSSFKHNADGFRGEDIQEAKPPGTFRIACLGGSTTYGIGASSNETTWPAMLQEMLNEALPGDGPIRRIEVINAGCVGYTTLESFVNFKMRVAKYQPNLTVVYHAVNDAKALGLPNFKVDHSHMRQVWKYPLPARMDILFGWSHLYGLLRGTDSIPTLSDATEMPRLNRKRPTDEELPPLLEAWRRNLEDIIAIARANNSEVMLATFAYTRAYDNPKRKWEHRSQLPLVDVLNPVVEEVALAHQTLLADIATSVGRLKDHYVDNVHFTDAGNEVVAKCISMVIEDSGLLRGR